MKRTTKLVLALASAFLMCGCVYHAKFYPVQGPLAAEKPVPVASARITGSFNSGGMSLTLPDGEVCEGRWHVASTPATSLLKSEWDSVYGNGFYVAHVVGTQLYAQATLRGNRGSVLNVEVFRSETSGEPGHDQRGPVQGVAQDNHGNTYKVAEF
ncbi:MAG: hypothetical protein ACRD4X_18050 [Candidatus Acidiferrales bacterium]